VGTDCTQRGNGAIVLWQQPRCASMFSGNTTSAVRIANGSGGAGTSTSRAGLRNTSCAGQANNFTWKNTAMADLRLLVAKSLNSSDLSASDIREMPIDRIGALAFADALGGALWALKWAGDARAYPRSLELLAARCKRSASDRILRQKICRMSLLEWLDDLCHACGGRRILVATDSSPLRACTICDGTGRRRHSDVWRMRQLGMEPEVYRKWERRVASVQHKIADAETRAWEDVSRQLGRSGALRRKPLDEHGLGAILRASAPATQG
jgi:hypothetical protein